MPMKTDWYEYVTETNLSVREIDAFYRFIITMGDNPDELSTRNIKGYWRLYVKTLANHSPQNNPAHPCVS